MERVKGIEPVASLEGWCIELHPHLIIFEAFALLIILKTKTIVKQSCKFIFTLLPPHSKK